MAGANIFAGILEGLGKALSTYGFGEVEQRNKLALKEKENEQFMNMMRMMGYKIPTGAGGTQPTPSPAPTSQSQITVKQRSTGQVGTIPANEFDPKLYERM